MLAHGAQAKTADDMCLRAITYKEAGNQPVRGVAGVIQTIRNRARKRKKSVCSVVKEPHQFSAYKMGMNLRNVKIPKNFLHKFSEASKMRPVVASCVEFYHTVAVKPAWSKERKFVGKIKDHKFYC
jgi:spore germination cell wall hydrolase CwlJ-like protein